MAMKSTQAFIVVKKTASLPSCTVALGENRRVILIIVGFQCDKKE